MYRDGQTDRFNIQIYIYTDMIFTYNIYRYHISDLIYTDRYRYIETDRQTDRQTDLIYRYTYIQTWFYTYHIYIQIRYADTYIQTCFYTFYVQCIVNSMIKIHWERKFKSKMYLKFGSWGRSHVTWRRSSITNLKMSSQMDSTRMLVTSLAITPNRGILLYWLVGHSPATYTPKR